MLTTENSTIETSNFTATHNYELFVLVAHIPLIGIGVAGNSLVLSTLCYKEFRTISNCFVVVLSITDLSVILGLGLLSVIQDGMHVYYVSDVWCTLISNICTISVAASFLSTKLICVHRYVRLTLSNVTYLRCFGNKNKVWAWCTLPIFVAGVIGFHTNSAHNRNAYFCATSDFIRSIVLFVAYVATYVTVIILYIITYRRLSRIQQHCSIKSSKKENLNEKTRTLRISVIFSSINIHLYLPFVLTSVIVWFSPHSSSRDQLNGVDRYDITAIEVVSILSRLLVVVCCSVNSIVYGVLNTTLRDYLLNKIMCRKQPPEKEASVYSRGGTSMNSMMSIRLSTLKKHQERTKRVVENQSTRPRIMVYEDTAVKSLNADAGIKPHIAKPTKRPQRANVIDNIHHTKFTIDPDEGQDYHVPVMPIALGGDGLCDTLQSMNPASSTDSLVIREIGSAVIQMSQFDQTNESISVHSWNPFFLDRHTPVSMSENSVDVWSVAHILDVTNVNNETKDSPFSDIVPWEESKKKPDEDATMKLVSATVMSRLDYCNSTLIGIPGDQIVRLQRVQNSAARLVLRKRKRDHVTPLLKQLHWLPIKARYHYKISVLAYRHFDGSLAPYLSSSLSVRKSSRTLQSSSSRRLEVPCSLSMSVRKSSRTLRSPNSRRLKVPRRRLKSAGERSFSFAAPTVWNSLPVGLRQLSDLDCFKANLKTYLFKQFLE